MAIERREKLFGGLALAFLGFAMLANLHMLGCIHLGNCATWAPMMWSVATLVAILLGAVFALVPVWVFDSKNSAEVTNAD